MAHPIGIFQQLFCKTIWLSSEFDIEIWKCGYHFGRSLYNIQIDPHTRLITTAEVRRDAACGCASYAAERLVGVSADEAEQEGGMLHQHFPCLASMGIDSDFSDTLMHVSGNIMRDEIGFQVNPFKPVDLICRLYK
ncbi:MAG TPA: DUF166 family protein [Anaerolineales bacterium]|nr:DUF166 family protein [Anaerolineales bacterium]